MSNHIQAYQGTLGGQSAILANARDLHAFLGIGRDFATWIKDRITEFGFVEGEDYSPFLGNRSDGRAGKPRFDYCLSIDMAKELAMVERTERGREARRYFIECERQLQEGGLPPRLSAPLSAVAVLDHAPPGVLADLSAQVRAQSAQIERLTRALLAAKDAELRLRRRQAATEAARRLDQVVLMECAGESRDAIVAATGLSFNYVRQIVFRARQRGDLQAAPSPQASLDLVGSAS